MKYTYHLMIMGGNLSAKERRHELKASDEPAARAESLAHMKTIRDSSVSSAVLFEVNQESKELRIVTTIARNPFREKPLRFQHSERRKP